MKIVIEGGKVVVRHGEYGRERETTFERQATALMEQDATAAVATGHRPPALNRYEWAAVEKALAVISTAIAREDTPYALFKDLLHGKENVNAAPQIVLAHPTAGDVELRIVREVPAGDFTVNKQMGTVEITNPDHLPALDGATYVEAEYSWEPSPMMLPWERPR